MLRDVNNGYRGVFVIISAFMIQFVAFGIAMSIGIYNVEFLDHWPVDALSVSLVGAINVGFFLGAGPIASYLMWKFHHRTIVISGAILSSLGMLPLPFMSSIGYFYVFYGLLAGLGFCFVYIPSHVMSGLYFDKHRSLATGLATAGSGLGSSVMPMIISYLIEKYDWKGSLLIMTGLCLNMIVFGALLKPLPGSLKDENVNTTKEEEAEEVKSGQMLKQTYAEVNSKTSLSDKSDYVHSDYGNDCCGDSVMQKEQKCVTHNDRLDYADEGQVLMSREQSEHSPICSPVTETSPVRDSQTVRTQDGKLTTNMKLHRLFLIFYDFKFDVFFINNILWNTAIFMVLAFAPEFFLTRHLDKMDGATMVTLAGFGSFLGSICGGFVGNFVWVNRLVLFAVCCLFLGVPPIVLPFIESDYSLYVALMFVFGFVFGMVLGLLVIITSDLLGPERIGDGLGFLMFSNGIGSFIGPVLAGFLRGVTGNYDLVMVISGLVCIISALLMMAIPLQARLICHRSRISSKDSGIDIDS